MNPHRLNPEPGACLLPYQAAWVRDPSRLRICQKSRQVGLSYADAYDSVRKAAVAGGRDVWVMSRDENQARQYLRYCRRWALALHAAAARHCCRILHLGKNRSATVQPQKCTFSAADL